MRFPLWPFGIDGERHKSLRRSLLEVLKKVYFHIASLAGFPFSKNNAWDSFSLLFFADIVCVSAYRTSTKKRFYHLRVWPVNRYCWLSKRKTPIVRICFWMDIAWLDLSAAIDKIILRASRLFLSLTTVVSFYRSVLCGLQGEPILYFPFLFWLTSDNAKLWRCLINRKKFK